VMALMHTTVMKTISILLELNTVSILLVICKVVFDVLELNAIQLSVNLMSFNLKLRVQKKAKRSEINSNDQR
jgi:hypothetical protein